MNFQALARTFTHCWLAILCIAATSMKSYGQVNYQAEDIFLNLVQGDTYTDTVFSSFNIFQINTFVDPLNEVLISVRSVSKDNYELKFSFTESGYIGMKDIEVNTISYTPTIQKKYRYHISIQPALIVAKDDLVKLEQGQQTVSINPLANDLFNDVQNKVLHLTDVKLGGANVNGNTINYSLPEGVYQDVVLYSVENYLGMSDQAAIFLYKDRPITSNEIKYTVLASKESRTLFLPSPNTVVSLSPKKGILEKINNQVYKYTANSSFDAFDKLIFISGGYNIVYNIEIKNPVTDIGQVKDDVFFTPTNTSTVFNVFDNDDTKFNSIINYSPELQYLGGGQFSYSPGVDFAGVKKFFYETGNKLNRETGEIEINVGNINPSDAYVYNFLVREGLGHHFTYDLPFDAYRIEINSHPLHGSAAAYRQTEGIGLECGMIKGKAVVSYYPMPGYTGSDEITIKYCAGDNACKIYKLRYNIVGAQSDDCDCGTDCVWPGDVNEDGVVSPSDLLTIGRNYGYTGKSRAETSNAWLPKEKSEWKNGGSPAVDANGDGLINRSDVEPIVENLGKLSKLVPSSYGNGKSFPFYLVPHATEVDSGDLMVFDIIVGDDFNPALNAYGLSFNVRFNPGFLDATSIKTIFYEDSWFGAQSPVLDFASMREDGLLTIAASRTINRGISGKGVLGQVTGIVKDELEGFKDEDAAFIMQNIIASSIVLEDFEGNKFNANPVQIPIKLNRTHKNKPSINDQLTVYPNPSAGDFYLALDGQDEILEVSMFDISGNLIRSYTKINSKQFSIVQDGLADGMYIVKIKTKTALLSKKVHILGAF